MTMKHTPGPWSVYRSGYACDRPGIDADIPFSVILFGDSEFDEAGIYGRTPEEAEANANLIAAAPDLLMHLKKLITAVDREAYLEGVKGLAWDRAQLAKAVVAEAEGETK